MVWFSFFLGAPAAVPGLGAAMPVYSKDGRIVVQAPAARAAYRFPVMIFADRVRQSLTRTTGLEFTANNGQLEIAVGSATNREQTVRAIHFRDAATGAVKERIELPDPEGADLAKLKEAVCESLLRIWVADAQIDAPSVPPGKLPAWLAAGLAHYSERESRQPDLDRTLLLWSHACLPPAAELLELDSAAASAEPAVAGALTGWLLDKKNGVSALERMLRAAAAGREWDVREIAAHLAGSPDPAAFDVWLDRKMDDARRTVIVPGLTTKGMVRRFRSSLLLFPAVSDIIDAPLFNGVSFQDALRHASDPVYREAALRQAGLVKLAAMGRDGTFLAVSKAYEAFLLAFAKGRKPGELVKLLLAADDALRAMEAQTADGAELRLPPEPEPSGKKKKPRK